MIARWVDIEKRAPRRRLFLGCCNLFVQTVEDLRCENLVILPCLGRLFKRNLLTLHHVKPITSTI